MLDGITDAMNMNLGKLQEMVRSGRTGVLQSMELQRVGHDDIELESTVCSLILAKRYVIYFFLIYRCYIQRRSQENYTPVDKQCFVSGAVVLKVRDPGVLPQGTFGSVSGHVGEGCGNPLQYSCLENPMGGGAWQATVPGVAKSQTQLSDFTFTFHFHVLEKDMATHSSVLAWRIPGTGEPGGLPSMGSHRVGHD